MGESTNGLGTAKHRKQELREKQEEILNRGERRRKGRKKRRRREKEEERRGKGEGEKATPPASSSWR